MLSRLPGEPCLEGHSVLRTMNKTKTHCSILAWEIPWTEEPGGLQSTGSQSVGQEQSLYLNR